MLSKLIPLAIALLISSVNAVAQTPEAAAGKKPAPLAFDVASIRLSESMDPAKMMQGRMRFGMKVDGARADFNFMSLADLIQKAYNIQSYQLKGPDWMKTQRFEIQATLPEGAKAEQVPEMLQTLLAERFKLQIHRDTKEHDIYALVVGKNGSKLKDAEPEPAPAADGAPKEEDPKDAKAGPSMTVNGEKMTFKQSKDGAVIRGNGMGTTKVGMNNGMIHMEMSKVDMTKFSEMLNQFLDRPVLDQTDLKGSYQITLDLSMADMMNVARKSGMAMGMGGPPPGGPGGGGAPGAFGGGGGPGAAGPAGMASDPGGAATVFTAVEQLGLKLNPKKGPIELIVVDKLEKAPTEN